MLTSEGCQSRRIRLWTALPEKVAVAELVLSDPIHLRYFANFYVDPFSLGADFGGVLVVRPDGHATLYHDRRLPESVRAAHVDRREEIQWYDGRSPGNGPRRLALRPAVEAHGGRIHDSLSDPLAPLVIETISGMRRRKDPDEIAVLESCMRATEAGHAWARQHIRAGMTELDVYRGVFDACSKVAGQPVIVYGDFAVSPGPARRGGPPTSRVLRDGDTFILDYSVVRFGYRSDFTNTLVVGGEPTDDQLRLFDACTAAMSAGESRLRGGQSCLAVYDAVRQPFIDAGLADHFPHHAGHGLGLSHPEAPYFVRQANETLTDGDVVTLEPGLYVDGIGGIRIERNYLITSTGFRTLSNHSISLT
jgi:Xaa-Pro aminopeptidase